jgi:hypothetical protein
MIKCGACGHTGSHAYIVTDDGRPASCDQCPTCSRFARARDAAARDADRPRQPYDYAACAGDARRAAVVLRGADMDGKCFPDEDGHTRSGGEHLISLPDGKSEYWTPDGTTETDPSTGRDLIVLRYTGR